MRLAHFELAVLCFEFARLLTGNKTLKAALVRFDAASRRQLRRRERAANDREPSLQI